MATLLFLQKGRRGFEQKVAKGAKGIWGGSGRRDIPGFGWSAHAPRRAKR
jgi:hypothetical protein